MTRNPARTVALVNLAVFALAVAVLLWLRQSGQWDVTEREASLLPIGSAEEVSSDSISENYAAADAISMDEVRPASAAQVDFLNEVLVDVPDGVQEAFSIRSGRHEEERYYVAAPIAQADTSVPDSLRVAVWRMRGSRDRPTTIAAVNEAAVQHSITNRVRSTDESGHADEAAIDALLQRIQRQ